MVFTITPRDMGRILIGIALGLWISVGVPDDYQQSVALLGSLVSILVVPILSMMKTD